MTVTGKYLGDNSSRIFPLFECVVVVLVCGLEDYENTEYGNSCILDSIWVSHTAVGQTHTSYYSVALLIRGSGEELGGRQRKFDEKTQQTVKY